MRELYEEKIKGIDLSISGLQREKEDLKRKKDSLGLRIKKWLDYPFESSSGLTKEFSLFSKDFKKYLKEKIKDSFDLVNWSRGHFGISGFLKNKKNNKLVYFSCSDVRHFPNSWYENLLIRTAKNEKDYTGGSNDYCKFPNIKEKAIELTA